MRFLITLLITALALAPAQSATPVESARKKAAKLQKQGNWQEAFAEFEKLLVMEGNSGPGAASDLNNASQCLQRLSQPAKFDAFVEAAIAAHPKDAHVLSAAAQLYFRAQNWGYVIAGEFQRGHHRGGGKQMNTRERDRARAMQLFEQAMLIGDESAMVPILMEFANTIGGNRHYGESWRLQNLTDLSSLPDRDEGYYNAARDVGTPVNPDGSPLFYDIPNSWMNAKNDGERWRFLLAEIAERDGTKAGWATHQWTTFLRRQFGVVTMQRGSYAGFFGGQGPREDDGKKNESGIFELHTLKETETICRLASGVRRLTLPDEHNAIVLLKRLADTDDGYAETALRELAQIFQNRRQYPRAAEIIRRSIAEHGNRKNKEKQLEQIIGNWGRFDGTDSHAAGTEPTLGYVFRNATKAEFIAYRVDVPALLDDIKEYLKDNPRELDHQRTNLGNIGHALVNERWSRYVKERAAEWELELEPRANHWDRRIDVKVPLKDAGAYLVRAKIAGGNTTNVVLWLADTAIVKKPLDHKTFYFVADATSGAPLPKANVEFFGWRTEYLDRKKILAPKRRFNVITKQFAEFTDANGQVTLDAERMPRGYQWLAIANGAEGKHYGFHGFSNVWHAQHHDSEYKVTKALFVTDRPVYRPGQKVEFKVWARHAQYDQEDVSQFAGKKIVLQIDNPKGEKVMKKTFTADEFGGVSGELELPEDATLGVYRMTFINGGQQGGNTFRVEEYKKPEFEVTVDAPSEPVMLGETLTAKVNARYLFGAPVQNATVKIKVLRSEHDSRWFAPRRWDWFYGPGYWWSSYDYSWYPGWSRWGCRAPHYWWWPRANMPPEVVLENELEIGEDGTVEIEIDTALAKAMHGDIDHRYQITAEVRDQSRRTIVGNGSVLVAREPFKVSVWVDRGYHRVGDVIAAEAAARTLDGKPVSGAGALTLLKISYAEDGLPVETEVSAEPINPDAEGFIRHQLKASAAGQYRLSYRLKDKAGHEIEGGYVFVVRGEGFDGKAFRFNDLELITDKAEYAPGETVKLMVNTERPGSTVALFLRPANGVYLPPTILRLDGKSTVADIGITKKDMPNFFIEAFTISGGDLYEQTREVIVPPEKRVLNVEVLPTKERYKPGEPAKVAVKLTDIDGEPFVGTTVVTVYDKALEYISGGSNTPEIREFFWKWRRHHRRQSEFNLNHWSANIVKKGASGMFGLGIFGNTADEVAAMPGSGFGGGGMRLDRRRSMAKGKSEARFGASVADELGADSAFLQSAGRAGSIANSNSAPSEPAEPAVVQPVVRTNFADTAFWVATLNTEADGTAEIELEMPENLTTWKIKTWGLGHGTRVGQGEAEVITSKNLIIRLQSPRFFVEKDEVVLSANIHNYLDTEKTVTAVLELGDETLQPLDATTSEQSVQIAAGGEQRVDWRVKATAEGDATITMKALTDEESDAMQMTFPVLVHGFAKTESFSGAIRPDAKSASIDLQIPAERRPEESSLEIRYSPSLAMAMVDALPYLVEYPYGCTEQTLNRFLPTVITQKILGNMGVDLAAVRDKQSNLNAQEIGDDKERAAQWKRWQRNPVFDEAEVEKMVKAGIDRLTAMQNRDGGWGWFYGHREHSYAHTTAVVVHGLQVAVENDVALVPGVLDKGLGWLKQHQRTQIKHLKNWGKNNKRPEKQFADNLDAMVFMILCDSGEANADMRDFLYRDRNQLAVYAKCMLGLAMHKIGKVAEREMLIRNIEQFLVIDDENQSAYLELGNGGYWWRWYGSEFEAQAYYLKLLAETKPDSPQASGLAKYLINNRKHATYWHSTRDTAVCIEALADYIRAAGEDEPAMTVEILLDGKRVKEVEINKDNLFTYDNRLLLEGDALTSGGHKLEFRKQGKGALYFNAYLTNFTLEDFITKAGLEVKVERQYYKLVPEEKTIQNVTQTGGSVDQKVEKFRREPLATGDSIKSGDLVEIELIIESKNDYEYIMFEDMKAAGFEPVEVRSGYGDNAMGAYMELRDQKVAFFVRSLARGKHSLAYRMRAETPGKFSALPARAEAMYAPELKANSDEMKIGILD